MFKKSPSFLSNAESVLFVVVPGLFFIGVDLAMGRWIAVTIGIVCVLYFATHPTNELPDENTKADK